MPWKETCAMQERIGLINDWLSKNASVNDLSLVYGVTRKTVYKWIERFKEGGFEGLANRSSARRSQHLQTPDNIVELILAARKLHTTWGPKKLQAWLERKHPRLSFPAASTIGDTLKRAGLVRPRRLHRRLQGADGSAAPPQNCHEIWNADFKGQFKLGNGNYCYPLTITDTLSRTLLCCDALTSTRGDAAQVSFRRVFEDYGLPTAIRTDNGVPFASTAAGRLSRLSIWWLKLGIKLIRITPGCPQENGSHERMHRTLKAETTRPPAHSAAAQQLRFDDFLVLFNSERPHEALSQETPWSTFVLSNRAYEEPSGDPEYATHWEIRRVRNKGHIKFDGAKYFVSEALCGELVGLLEIDDGIWKVHFASHPVGEIRLREGCFKAYGQRGAGVSRRKRYT